MTDKDNGACFKSLGLLLFEVFGFRQTQRFILNKENRTFLELFSTRFSSISTITSKTCHNYPKNIVRSQVRRKRGVYKLDESQFKKRGVKWKAIQSWVTSRTKTK